MNILFITLIEIDNLNKRNIYTDLMSEFKKNGNNIYIVSPSEKRKGHETNLTINDGVSYLKVKTGNITKTNLIEKFISTIRIEGQFYRAIKKNFPNTKFDLILYSTPPITFGKTVKKIKKRDKATSYLLLKDIFPQNAIDLEMFTKLNPVYWFFRRKEKKLYKVSDYIGCMSEANVKYILEKNRYLEASKVEVAPNSIKPINYNLVDINKSDIYGKYNIPLNKTVYIYGGNLGAPQGIDFLIDVLRSNRNNSDVHFLIVGSGTKYKTIEKFLNNEKIENASLFEAIPKEEYDKLVILADVGLIFLDKRFTIPNIPSRLLTYMEMSKPVLAATDVNTDLNEIISKGDFGFWCQSGDLSCFNAQIQKLNEKKLRVSLGKNGRIYLEENYTTRVTYSKIMEHFVDERKG